MLNHWNAPLCYRTEWVQHTQHIIMIIPVFSDPSQLFSMSSSWLWSHRFLAFLQVCQLERRNYIMWHYKTCLSFHTSSLCTHTCLITTTHFKCVHLLFFIPPFLPFPPVCLKVCRAAHFHTADSWSFQPRNPHHQKFIAPGKQTCEAIWLPLSFSGFLSPFIFPSL